MGNPIVRKTTLIGLGLLLCYKVLLDVSYAVFVHRLYEYMGFKLGVSFIKVLESYIMVMGIYSIMPKRTVKISDVVVIMLFVLVVVPSVSYYAMADEIRPFAYSIAFGFVLTMGTIRLLPLVRLKAISRSRLVLIGILVLHSAIVFFFLLKNNRIPNLGVLLFDDIYNIRAEVNYGPFFMGYFVKWQGNVINCLLLAYAWYKRSTLLTMVSIAMIAGIFLYTGHKSFVVLPFPAVFLVYAAKRGQITSIVLGCLSFGIFLSLMSYQYRISNIPASLLIRRGLFVPAQITFAYQDYFAKNPHVFLAHSKVSFGLIENPYGEKGLNVANMMGQIYAGNEDTAMNTGYYGDAYMNFGYAGVFIFSALLGIVLKVADWISRRRSFTLSLAAMIVPMIKLSNGSLFSVTLTGGILFSFVVVFLLGDWDPFKGDNRKGSIWRSGFVGNVMGQGCENNLGKVGIRPTLGGVAGSTC